MSDAYGNPRVPHHRTGPEQDQAARLAVVRGMSGRFSVEEMAETLEMIGLLPGQEKERNVAGMNLASLPGRDGKACGPKSKIAKVYIPN